MNWVHYVAYFSGGFLFANAIPHWVSGALGRPFQSPFAKPPGEGLSSSTVNVLWGGFNFAIAYLLLCRVGNFDLRNTSHVLVVGVPAFLGTLFAARHFGRFHGGNDARRGDPA